MIVRPERAEDERELAALIDAAFGDTETSEFTAQIRASPGYVPELTFVADDGGELVGFTMLSYVTAGGRDVLILTPMAVRPDRQRDGDRQAGRPRARSRPPRRAASRSCSSRACPPTTRSSASAPRASSASSGPTRGSPRPPGWRSRSAAYDPAVAGRVVYPDFFPPPPNA